MKRYRFRLEPVLRVRRLEEDQARAELAKAQAVVAQREQDLVAAAQAYQHAIAQPPPSGDANEFLREQQRRAGIAQHALNQRQRLLEAKAHVEHFQQAWSEAKQKVGALENLDERKRAEHAAEAIKEDDAAIDELVTGRFGRNER